MVICMVKISVTFRVFRVNEEISSRQKMAKPVAGVFSAGLDRIDTLNNTRNMKEVINWK